MPQIINQKLDWSLVKRLKFLFWVLDWTNFTQFWISLQTVSCIQWKADFPHEPTKCLSGNCSRNFLNGMPATSIINIDLVLNHSKIKQFPLSWVPPCEGKSSQAEASLCLPSNNWYYRFLPSQEDLSRISNAIPPNQPLELGSPVIKGLLSICGVSKGITRILTNNT